MLRLSPWAWIQPMQALQAIHTACDSSCVSVDSPRKSIDATGDENAFMPKSDAVRGRPSYLRNPDGLASVRTGCPCPFKEVLRFWCKLWGSHASRYQTEFGNGRRAGGARRHHRLPDNQGEFRRIIVGLRRRDSTPIPSKAGIPTYPCPPQG